MSDPNSKPLLVTMVETWGTSLVVTAEVSVRVVGAADVVVMLVVLLLDVVLEEVLAVVVVVVVCAGKTLIPDGESSPDVTMSSTLPPFRSARWILRVEESVQYNFLSLSSMATSAGVLRPEAAIVSNCPP